jgi:hypothetical protein
MEVEVRSRDTLMPCLLGTLALCGCTAQHKNVLVNPPLLDPLVETKHAVVLISYHDDLVNHTCSTNAGQGTNWHFSLGPPSVEMFDALMRSLFTEVALPDGDLPSPTSDFTEIQIELDRFSICPTFEPGVSPVEIGYRLTIQPPNSDRPLTWLGTGRAEAAEYQYDGWKEITEGKFTTEQYLEQVTSTALRYAVADLVVNLHDDPQLAKWRNSLPSVGK